MKLFSSEEEHRIRHLAQEEAERMLDAYLKQRPVPLGLEAIKMVLKYRKEPPSAGNASDMRSSSPQHQHGEP
ncbi:MAG: hypothetical protein HY664_08435 [Chloroflexi bacterium]|nr:hypothetical protein [Chloroflexota bacterium]